MWVFLATKQRHTVKMLNLCFDRLQVQSNKLEMSLFPVQENIIRIVIHSNAFQCEIY